MKKIRCIAVDDEPLSLKVIEKYAAELPLVELIGTCANAFEAMEWLRKEQVDLVFLDINMPKLSGIGLLKSLDKAPLVVFTTAYPEYAVEGFDLEALDYLLKPFSLERFIRAVNRAAERISSNSIPANTAIGHLVVKADKKMYRIDLQDISYLEAYGDYVKIHAKSQVLLVKERLGSMERDLPVGQFVRIHRSFIVSIAAIEFMEGNLVKIANAKLPVSENFREKLLAIFGR